MDEIGDNTPLLGGTNTIQSSASEDGEATLNPDEFVSVDARDVPPRLKYYHTFLSAVLLGKTLNRFILLPHLLARQNWKPLIAFSCRSFHKCFD
tara:strand:+ start:233 stop:514 length:282 start_codon:yes stop_codon:yes gene_type:complete